MLVPRMSLAKMSIATSPCSPPAALTVSITECSAPDMSACMSLVSTSFGRTAPFMQIFYPAHDDGADGSAQAASRMQSWHATADPEVTHFLAAKVTADEAVSASTATVPAGLKRGLVGFAVWSFMRDVQPDALEETGQDVDAIWGRKGGESECKLVRQVWRDYVRPRNNAIRDAKGRGVWVLEMLCVHPEMRRRGIGEKLVRWGTENADKHQAQAVVESTRAGRKAYEKCGFVKEIDPMTFQVDDEFRERRLPDLLFMTRPAKKASYETFQGKS